VQSKVSPVPELCHDPSADPQDKAYDGVGEAVTPQQAALLVTRARGRYGVDRMAISGVEAIASSTNRAGNLRLPSEMKAPASLSISSASWWRNRIPGRLSTSKAAR